jgi:hypothetical protein
MKCSAAVAVCLFALSACTTTTVPLTLPIDLVAKVSNPTHTGWNVDFCHDGKLINSLPECAQLGGEIYRVELLHTRTSSGAAVVSTRIIGLSAHALDKDYRFKASIHLEEAPKDFRESTGIEYLARDWERL